MVSAVLRREWSTKLLHNASCIQVCCGSRCCCTHLLGIHLLQHLRQQLHQHLIQVRLAALLRLLLLRLQLLLVPLCQHLMQPQDCFTIEVVVLSEAPVVLLQHFQLLAEL